MTGIEDIMQAPDCSIIIVNFNTMTLLDKCLKSVFDSEGIGRFEIIVVDNGSSDQSVAMVRQRFPAVRVIANSDNLGFSRANNQGINVSSGATVLLLNSDTEVYPDSIAKMVDFMKLHADAGIIGPRVLNSDLTYQATGRNFPEPVNAFFGRKSALTRLFPNNRFSRRYMTCLDEEKMSRDVYEVDWVSGACMMVKREILEQVGLLDEGYFFYWEDVDLCYRVKSRGWKVYYLNAASIIHHEGKSRGRKNIRLKNRLNKEFYKGAYRYYCKHRAPCSADPRRLAALMGISAKAAVVFLVDNIKYLAGQVRAADK